MMCVVHMPANITGSVWLKDQYSSNRTLVCKTSNSSHYKYTLIGQSDFKYKSFT